VAGDPLDARTDMGPIGNRPQYARVRGMIGMARDDGETFAKIDGFAHLEQSPGLFVPPTIVLDVDPHSRIAQQEVFGPVLAVIRFADESEAVHIANDSEYALAAGVWTRNLGRAHRMIRELDSGVVWVNTYRATAAQAPFGGRKHSGYGRERGEEALNDYTRSKNAMIETAPSTARDPFVVST
jgi:acyl-CoA reductase-like NAD-dependent aldehyde dehydrogenase